MKYLRTTIRAGKRLIAVGMLAGTGLAAAVSPVTAEANKITFKLYTKPRSAACPALAGCPASETTVTVMRGALADTLYISARHCHPNLEFDLFTIRRSQFLANRQFDPKFTNFGEAWYQTDTDLETDAHGNSKGPIKTTLLDRIFGFDPDVSLLPTQALRTGLWFGQAKAEAEDQLSVAASGENEDVRETTPQSTKVVRVSNPC